MATNFVTTGLADFTAANPQKALALVLLEGVGTKDHYSYEEGVKYQTKIPYISNVSVDISTGSFAGYNTGSGSTTAVDVTLANKQFKIFETYTKETLNKTILAGLGKKGSDPNELPLEDQIVALKGKSLALANEKMIWQADTSTSVQTAGTSLNSFDGILAQCRAGVGNPLFTATAFSTLSDASVLFFVNNAYKKLVDTNEAFANIPTILSMAPAQMAVYARALYNLNGTVTTQTVGADGKGIMEVYIPGTQCKAVSEIGLSGSNKLFATHPDNVIVCYDLVSEDEKLELLYNPFARQYELFAGYKLGVKIVDVSSCVLSA